VALQLVAMLVTPVVVKCETKNERSPGPEVEEKKN